MKKLSLIAAAMLFSSTLLMSGCTNREMGTAGGAALGGVVGYGLTGGSAAGTAIGAVGGGIIGNNVSR